MVTLQHMSTEKEAGGGGGAGVWPQSVEDNPSQGKEKNSSDIF